MDNDSDTPIDLSEANKAVFGADPEIAGYKLSGFMNEAAARAPLVSLAVQGIGRITGNKAIQEMGADAWKRVKKDLIGSTASEAYSAADSALFGVPTLIAKTVSKPAYNRLKELRSQYKFGALSGDIGGLAIPTGGGLYSAAGKGAEKLGAKGLGTTLKSAGEIVKGTKAIGSKSKILAGAGRAALGGAEQVAARVASGEMTPQEALASVAVGGAIGGAMHAPKEIGAMMTESAEKANKWANKTILKRADVTSKIMKQQLPYMSGDVPGYMKELADFAEAKQLHREPNLDKLVKEVKGTWGKMASAYDADAVKEFPMLSHIVNSDDVLARPEIVQAVNRNGPAMVGKVEGMAEKISKTEGFANRREYLNEILYDPSASVDEKKIARAFMDQIEGEAEKLSGLDIGPMKHEWKMMKPFERADIMDDLNMASAGIKGGSPTAFNLALTGLGAAAGGSSQLQGVVDNPTDPKSWEKLVGGAVGGAIMGRANKAIGISLAKAVRVLPTERVGEIAEKVASGKLAQLMAKVPPDLYEATLPKAIAVLVAGKEDDDTAADSMITPTDSELAKAAGVPTAHEAQVIQAAKYGEAYTQKVNNAMMQYWAQNFADESLPYYMTFEDYAQRVSEATNGYDPRKTASFLYPDKDARRRYLKSLDVMDAFKSADIEKAFTGFSNKIEDKQRADIIDAVAGLVTKEGDLPTEADKKTIKADIDLIMKLRVPKDAKMKLLYDKLSAKYGLSYEELASYGLA